ncbi:serine hydrolase [Runella sp.]|uniref:serine hydrolase n=1 Tax=Runella sp. TaxID=1960881 RepID=UPI003D0FD614
MKNFIVLLLLLCHCTFFLSAQSQSAKTAAKIDSIFAAWNKPGTPGAAVGVVYQGKLIYAKGFGEADVETGAPITPKTIFHVASVSKQFTAYAITLLAQQGKLSLDDEVRKYIPELADFGHKITIRHLLHHTSGLRDQWNLLVMAGWQMEDVITKENILNVVKRQRELNFLPGAEYTYSNTGYTLLAEIVARVSKQPFPDWMKKNIFEPLKMESTLFYDDHQRIVKGRAYSFYKTSDLSAQPYKKDVLSYANAGATSLFTTVEDMAHWIGNFRTQTVGDQATMKQMLERGRLNKGDTISYAFALDHGKYKGLAYYGHSGGDAGFRSYVCYFPKEDYGFIVFSNAAEFNPVGKAFDVAQVYMGGLIKEASPVKAPEAASRFKEQKIDPALLDAYVGDYELVPGFVLSFKREGNRFITQATGQGPAEVFPYSDSTFFLKIVDAQVTFHRSKDGKVDKLTLHQNGNKTAHRVAPFSLTAEELKEYAGKYYSPELETFYTIKIDSDQLKLVHIHHGETTLKPLSKNKLQVPWWFFQSIEMVRDASNTIIGLKVSNGRVRNLRFKRLPADFGE